MLYFCIFVEHPNIYYRIHQNPQLYNNHRIILIVPLLLREKKTSQ